MVMTEEGLKTQVVVIDIPQLDAEVGGAGSEVSTLLIEGDVVNGI